MKTPKYRFLLGTARLNRLMELGYYDKDTGAFVNQSQNVAETKGQYIHSGFSSGSFETGFISADGTFVDENSYVSIYTEVAGQTTYQGYVQMSELIGGAYALPTVGSVSLSVTLSIEEIKKNRPLPIYILREVKTFYSKLAKNIRREGEHKFFREVLDTDLHFVGEIADFILNADVDDKFMLICQRYDYTTNSWSNYHVDLFKQTDCEFNRDTHTCTPQLSPLDAYSRILDRYSDEYDLIKLKPAITRIRTYLRPIIELYERGSSVITRFLGGTYWETEVRTPVDDEQVLANAHFAQIDLSEEYGYIRIDEVYEMVILPASRLPLGYYYFDGVSQCYRYENNQNLTWSLVQLPDVFVQRVFLRLELSGQPVISGGSNWIVIRMPGGLSHMPFTWNDLEVHTYNTVYEGMDAMGGKGIAHLYDIWARVVGNGDILFNTDTFDIPQDDFAISSAAYKKCAPLGKGIGLYYNTSDTSLEPTVYGIKENANEYYTNENLPVGDGSTNGGIYGVKPMPIGKYEWGDVSYWYNYDGDYVALETASRYEYEMKDCFKIGDVIRALLSEVDHTIIFEDRASYSQFLYSAPGIRGGYMWKLAITPKSNVLKGDYDQPAQKAPITFEGLMNMLHDLYQLYWYIDENRHLHIEHELWFANGGSYSAYNGGTQLDLTGYGCKDAFNKKRTAYWQDAYKFNMNEATRRIELDFSEKGTEFFNGLSIDIFNTYLAKAKTDSKSIANFTADIDLMRIEPDKYSSDGFAVLTYMDEEQGGPVQPFIPVSDAVRVKERDGHERDAYVNNLFASWLYCQHFLMFNLSGDDMEQELQMLRLPNNASLDRVYKLARLKKQTVQFPFDDDPDTIGLIKTDIGDGVPEDFSVDALTRTVKATLSFPVKELPPQQQRGLTFTAKTAGTTVRLDKAGVNSSTLDANLEFSTDGGYTWQPYSWAGDNGGTVTLPNVGDEVRFRGDNEQFSLSSSAYYHFVIAQGSAEASDDITFLLSKSGGDVAVPNYAFYQLFVVTPITTTPNLPSTTLGEYAYWRMFASCSYITSVVLPAIILTPRCYRNMFYGCASLNYVEMHATDISATNCITDWLDGVAAVGVLRCDQSLNIPSGASGIPTGWARVNL